MKIITMTKDNMIILIFSSVIQLNFISTILLQEGKLKKRKQLKDSHIWIFKQNKHHTQHFKKIIIKFFLFKILI